MEKKNLIFFITNLEAGGAQRSLYQLIKALKNRNPETSCNVISLKSSNDSLCDDFNVLCDKTLYLGLPNLSLKKTINLLFFLRKEVCKENTYIIGWMYHACLFAWVTSLFKRKIKTFFSIHHSGLDKENLKSTTFFLVRILKFLSFYRVEKIVYCAESSMNIHNDFGFNKKISTVIFNGIDIKEKFTKNKIQPSKNDFKIIMAARFDEIKNHDVVFSAMQSLIKTNSKISLTLCGEDTDSENIGLIRKIEEYDISNNIILKGVDKNFRENVAKYDILILPSKSEAFPLVIPEAMYKGTPCIASKVGDIPIIIDSCGWLIEPNSTQDLIKAIDEALVMKDKYFDVWSDLKEKCKIRVINNFSIISTLNKFENILN